MQEFSEYELEPFLFLNPHCQVNPPTFENYMSSMLCSSLIKMTNINLPRKWDPEKCCAEYPCEQTAIPVFI